MLKRLVIVFWLLMVCFGFVWASYELTDQDNVILDRLEEKLLEKVEEKGEMFRLQIIYFLGDLQHNKFVNRDGNDYLDNMSYVFFRELESRLTDKFYVQSVDEEFFLNCGGKFWNIDRENEKNIKYRNAPIVQQFGFELLGINSCSDMNGIMFFDDMKRLLYSTTPEQSYMFTILNVEEWSVERIITTEEESDPIQYWAFVSKIFADKYVLYSSPECCGMDLEEEFSHAWIMLMNLETEEEIWLGKVGNVSVDVEQNKVFYQRADQVCEKSTVENIEEQCVNYNGDDYLLCIELFIEDVDCEIIYEGDVFEKELP